jgi:hypothetical protein
LSLVAPHLRTDDLTPSVSEVTPFITPYYSPTAQSWYGVAG